MAFTATALRAEDAKENDGSGKKLDDGIGKVPRLVATEERGTRFRRKARERESATWGAVEETSDAFLETAKRHRFADPAAGPTSLPGKKAKGATRGGKGDIVNEMRETSQECELISWKRWLALREVFSRCLRRALMQSKCHQIHQGKHIPSLCRDSAWLAWLCCLHGKHDTFRKREDRVGGA